MGVGITVGVGVSSGAGLPDAIPAGRPGFTSLMGMANPMPVTARPVSVRSALAEISPTTLPSSVSSGPPLLPGLSDASVCR